MERLQKYLSECGVASRRKCEEIILNKKVKVNGKIIDELGHKVSDSDYITVNDIEVKKKDKYSYYYANLGLLMPYLNATKKFSVTP